MTTLSTKAPRITIGDVIMSRDFPGVSDCYMIGLVSDIKDGMIYCKGISRVFEGKSECMEGDFRTPCFGEMMSDTRYPNRLTVLM